jgi:cytochrome c peroxidase
VNGIGAWDAITAWVQFKVPSPVSPYTGVDPNSDIAKEIAKGRDLFTQAKCQVCHGGAKWSTSQVDFARTSPFPEALTVGAAPEPPTAQLTRFLHQVGTFDPANALEKTANNQQALGQSGFNSPSLLSIFAFGPYLHNGSCATLDCVLQNQAHRDAGGVTGVLDDPAAQAAVVKFLISIDASTAPIAP